MRPATALIWLVVLLAGCGGGPATMDGTAALQRVGLAETDAQRYAVESLATGQAYGLLAAAGRAFKALPDDERGGVIHGLAGWARSYAESDLFADAYAARRSSSMPAPPEHTESVDEAVERWTREGLEELESMRRSTLPMLPEADRAEMLERLETMEAQYRNPELLAIQRQGIEMERAEQQRSYEAALARWAAELPEDPGTLIAQRLHEFLDTCADVDFDAELVERYGRLRFADPDYERRPWAWKLCFRAGAASVEAARRVATGWLEELEG